jgi:hypothetical protein
MQSLDCHHRIAATRLRLPVETAAFRTSISRAEPFAAPLVESLVESLANLSSVAQRISKPLPNRRFQNRDRQTAIPGLLRNMLRAVTIMTCPAGRA